jgi:hypothetical protein
VIIVTYYIRIRAKGKVGKGNLKSLRFAGQGYSGISSLSSTGLNVSQQVSMETDASMDESSQLISMAWAVHSKLL